MGWIKNIFKKKEVVMPPADLSVLKTDIHSHFIPGIDDGAQNMEETLDLLREMQALGYSKVITTPHIMSDYYKNTPEIILGGLEKVREAIKSNHIKIEIEAAAEYYLDEYFEEQIAKENLLTFGDNYVLFELPFISEPPTLDRAIFNMQTAGYKPVLAHPERYMFWHNDLDKYQTMIDKGVLLQINTNSLSGMYAPEVKKVGAWLIENNMISILGSDCHNMRHVNAMQKAVTSKPLHDLLASGKLINTKF